MNCDNFLKQCLLLDLETDENGRIYHIGAVFGQEIFRRQKHFKLGDALTALDCFGAKAQFILGHNLLGHDLPRLRAANPSLKLLKKDVIDTLFLSPLAFPENPYHRLVKDYQLVRDAANDPVADAKLAARVFAEQWQAFTTLLEITPATAGLYRHLLGSYPAGTGLAAALRAMGAPELDPTERWPAFCRLITDKVCQAALAGMAADFNAPDKAAAIAYTLAWLTVAGANSVLPPWVGKRFPLTASLLRQLRDIPCQDPHCAYCQEAHNPRRNLMSYFAYDSFRPKPAAPAGGSLQEHIVNYAAGDQPLFATLPTGGGKSLCFQLPALMRYARRGLLTIVISPLQALMSDQVYNLTNKTGTNLAGAISGMLTLPERGEVLERVRLGDIAILYISPEQLRNPSLINTISQREIGAYIFDEAHCLSKWGHDFRTDYLYAARFIKEFSLQQHTHIPPVQCFTATAKKDVRDEILNYFKRELGQKLAIFEGGHQRNNLAYDIYPANKAEKYPSINDILHQVLDNDGCAIIYCSTRQGSEELADYLVTEDWQAEAFHAGLTVAAKQTVHDNFTKGISRIICATSAFGMGIDKDDVRLVIHADIPSSLESYLQEAGRAGRDQMNAQCILIYDENDIETQFRLSSLSQLQHWDIVQILRELRRGKKNKHNETVLTAGELLRQGDIEASFDVNDRNAETKVRAAISWLERAGFLQRNENANQVFQGRPLVRDMIEAQKKIAGLKLPHRQEQRWLAILEALMNREPSAGFSADELAELSSFTREEGLDNDNETEAQRVIRTLHDMAAQGIISKELILSAFVRHKVQMSSRRIMADIFTIEQEMLAIMEEEAPISDADNWHYLSLRKLNQAIINRGHNCSPEILRNILTSLAHDGKGLAAQQGSLKFRAAGQDNYRVKLQRDWASIKNTALLRRQISQCILQIIIKKIPADSPGGASLLVEFSMEEIVSALQHDMFLAAQVHDHLAAAERGLLYLHEHRIIVLQKGLAVFRQAMTIKLLPESKGRKYGKSCFTPLAEHYKERSFQIHVMNEYAHRALEKISRAWNMVSSYFNDDKKDFVEHYFSGRDDILERATSEQSYQRLVSDLENPAQEAIVTADNARNILILAGPGAGKTRVIAHRCAWLLRVKRLNPSQIVMLCFNRNAAQGLRLRLRNLASPEAAGVTVMTYHGLAMRLTGRSFASDLRPGEEIDFDEILREAIALIRGELEIPGLEADEIRDHLLRGWQYLLVDEYQDVDQLQYELISAISGRKFSAEDEKLTIIAVGDDDQNIYNFRGANIAFIKRFQEDYQSEIHYLTDNYRSSAHIIAAASQLISHNHDRMKGDKDLTINSARRSLPEGGNWQSLDPLSRGRVQRFKVKDATAQAWSLVEELLRLRQLKAGMAWSSCAVLARDWGELGPIRAVCEEKNIPVEMSMAGNLPPLHRVREIATFLDELDTRHNELVRGDELLQNINKEAGAGKNPWQMLLSQLVSDWQRECGGRKLPVGQLSEYIYEGLAERRRQNSCGQGVFLSTVHSAKGLEFDHVFVIDGGWQTSEQRYDHNRMRGENQQDKSSHLEEGRRLYYVAMTRAAKTLSLWQRTDCANPFVREIKGNFILDRQTVLNEKPGKLMRSRYDIVGLRDIDIGFAGSIPAGNPIHTALASLKAGGQLIMRINNGRIFLENTAGLRLASLSKSGIALWQTHLPEIKEVRIAAMVRWRQKECGSEYLRRCRVPQWEIPIVEVIR